MNNKEKEILEKILGIVENTDYSNDAEITELQKLKKMLN